MTIRRRLILSLVAIVGLFALNLGVYWWADGERRKSVRQLTDAVDKQLRVAEFAGQVGDLQERTALFAALLGTEDQPALEVEELQAAIDAIGTLRNRAGELTRRANENDQAAMTGMADAFERTAGQWTAFYAQFSPSHSPEPSADAVTQPAQAPVTRIDAPTDAFDALSSSLATLDRAEQAAVNQATTAITEVETLTTRTTLIIFGVSATLALVLALSLIRTVSRGLGTLKRGAIRIGEGDLQHRIGLTSNDEMGDLSQAFDQMSDRLELTMREVQSARDAATEANRAKSTFLANMSHELRTPMNAIIGYTEMLIEDAEDTGQEDFIPDLEKVLAASRHLLSLINDVLDLSKIEAGGMTLFIEEFSPVTLIADVVNTVRPLVGQNANELTVNIEPSMDAMTADQTKVRQTLFNLLSNACKFTERGSISLTASQDRQADTIVIEVSDSGIGMDEEQLKRVFEPFTQADSSTSNRYGGTGLGLSISKEFCELMGGRIVVDSEINEGTTFSVTLPRVMAEAESSHSAEPVSLPAGSGRGTVLVIDDDERVLELSARILKKQGFSVATSNNGERGLELARALHPTAVILDIIMPGMDGWQVLSALKADSETAELPVVLMTMLDDRETGFALGATEYLTKPIDRNRLAEFFDQLAPETSTGDILVVEDDRATRAALCRSLEQRGSTVRSAENGRIALVAMQERQPDLIFLDLMMPEMDGFEFLEHLRANDAWRGVAVVVITAKSLTEHERARLNGYVDEVVQKSGQSPDDIFSSVNDLLAQMGKTRLPST
ncbi:MAG: response regulator [Pseudomonadota bacterium]